MIVVTCQYTDSTTIGSGNYNGGWALHFYNVDEAKNLARIESEPEGGIGSIAAITKVYVDGVKVVQYIDGSPF